MTKLLDAAAIAICVPVFATALPVMRPEAGSVRSAIGRSPNRLRSRGGIQFRFAFLLGF